MEKLRPKISCLLPILTAQILAMSDVAPQLRVAAATTPSTTTDDLTQYVNPFIGTDGGGETFPGADTPFGMVQWSPDTSSWSPGGYIYSDSTIKGFSLTHLSGTGCPIYQDIPFVPFVGSLDRSPATSPSTYVSSFSHASEQAMPGYYKVQLGSGVQVELTVTRRTGFGRFTYPASTAAQMLINVGGSVHGDSDASAQIVGNDEVTGSASSTGFCGRATPYTVYFAAQFSRSFTGFGTWNGATISPGSTTTMGGQSGAYVMFDTTQDPVVLVKVGVSFVSVQNAVLNLQTENANPLTSAGFNAVRTAADSTWNAMLKRIQISGGTPADELTFYTALYHAFLQPNVFSDVNGQYPGFDNHVHSTQAYTQYANYSGWDIYRTEIPLLALLAPRETGDMMQSLVADAQQSGWLPRWAVASDHADVMVGDPADPIIASAYAFGATHFDTGAALQAMIKGATQSGATPGGYVERPYLADYVGFGYILRDHEPWWSAWSAARTLEYTTADFSIAQFAQALGDTATFDTFMSRAQSWQNLFNPATGYIQPRLSNGEFVPNFDPASDDGYIEGNGAQYTWMVPYNLHALFNAMGGNQQVARRLDAFFTQLNAGPDVPYSWLGNEPGLEVPWEYDFAGAPWRTQAVVRQAMNQLFSPSPGGLPGNDDLGTMSAWYVWAAIGLYPEIPGVGDLVIGSPLFPQITLHLANGDVTITAPGASDTTPYVQSLTVNCQPYSKPWLPLAAIANGATIQFTLGNTANSAWGADRADAPPSFAIGEAPAIGFTSGGNGGPITVTAGSSQSFHLGVQGVTDAPLAVRWSASPPSGLRLDSTTGTVAVSSATSRTQVLTVAASISMPPGDYIIPFHLQVVPSGQGTAIAMPAVDVEVVVNSPPPTATLTNMSVPPVATPASPTNTNAPTLPTATRIATRAASRPIARRVTHMRRPVLRGNALCSIVIHNGAIIVNVRTAPRMRVRISVKLTHMTYFVMHRGRHRRRVARAVVLYATTVRTKANYTGCITESIPIAYAPPKPVWAVLIVMVHTKQGTTIRRIGLTIQAPRHHRRPPRAMPRRITIAGWMWTHWNE